MIIVGFKDNRVVYENDGFLIAGEFLDFSEIINHCKAFDHKIYTDYGDNFSYCKMLSPYGESMIEENGKVLIVKDLSYISRAAHSDKKTFVFYNDEKDIVIKELKFENTKDRITEILRIFDIKLQEKINQCRANLELPSCDKKYAKEIVMYFFRDEYDGYWESDSVLRAYIETKEGWEEFIKNKIVRHSILVELFGRPEDDGEFVHDVFYEAADFYPECELRKDSVWNSELADMIYRWYREVEVNIK
jgi:hypothetical protein